MIAFLEKQFTMRSSLSKGMNDDSHNPVHFSIHLDLPDQTCNGYRQVSVPPFPPRQSTCGKKGYVLGIYAGDGLGVCFLGGGSGRRPYLCGTNVQAGGDYGLLRPEQWKEMVGGEEAWKTIPYVKNLLMRNIHTLNKLPLKESSTRWIIS